MRKRFSSLELTVTFLNLIELIKDETNIIIKKSVTFYVDLSEGMVHVDSNYFEFYQDLFFLFFCFVSFLYCFLYLLAKLKF